MLTATTRDLQIHQIFARSNPVNLLSTCTFAGDEDDVSFINDFFCVLLTIGLNGLGFLEVVLVGMVLDELKRGKVPKGGIFVHAVFSFFLRGREVGGEILAKIYT
jgi:hypothetical protein